MGLSSSSSCSLRPLCWVYVFLGGLRGAIYNQVLQFFLLVAGFLPMVLLGLRRLGGWSGLKAAVPAAYLHPWQGVAPCRREPHGC